VVLALEDEAEGAVAAAVVDPEPSKVPTSELIPAPVASPEDDPEVPPIIVVTPDTSEPAPAPVVSHHGVEREIAGASSNAIPPGPQPEPLPAVAAPPYSVPTPRREGDAKTNRDPTSAIALILDENGRGVNESNTLTQQAATRDAGEEVMAKDEEVRFQFMMWALGAMPMTNSTLTICLFTDACPTLYH
jgi:hypothetical protein